MRSSATSVSRSARTAKHQLLRTSARRAAADVLQQEVPEERLEDGAQISMQEAAAGVCAGGSAHQMEQQQHRRAKEAVLRRRAVPNCLDNKDDACEWTVARYVQCVRAAVLRCLQCRWTR